MNDKQIEHITKLANKKIQKDFRMLDEHFKACEMVYIFEALEESGYKVVKK